MKVRDVMSKKVITVSPQTTFREIGKITFGRRFSQKFSSVPVVDKKGKLVGIVTGKDLLKRLYPSEEQLIEDFFEASNFYKMEENVHSAERLTAQEIMTKTPRVTSPETPLLKAGSLMIVERVRRLPVIDKKGKLVGIISQGDIFRAVFQHLKNHRRQH